VRPSQKMIYAGECARVSQQFPQATTRYGASQPCASPRAPSNRGVELSDIGWTIPRTTAISDAPPLRGSMVAKAA
jgi:hypothetical protein